MTKPLEVLVIDDSAVVREMLKAVLTQEDDFEVTTASDPMIAIEKMRNWKPDVIILDLELPKMHGLDFLKKIMEENPLPVVICSALSGQSAELAFKAKDLGAVEIIVKPQLGVREFLHESAITVIDKVRSAAKANLQVMNKSVFPLKSAVPKHPPMPKAPARRLSEGIQVIGIGASTGGIEALTFLFSQFPDGLPGIVIVQHLPEQFTKSFAARLNQVGPVRVKEAQAGDLVKRGHAYVAPGNSHVLLEKKGKNYLIRLSDGPLVSRHRPSVDVLFQSVAQVVGAGSIGILLTGMGKDGALGLLEMKQAGARTIAQNQSSCVVFGMPREAIQKKAAEFVVPLNMVCSHVERLVVFEVAKSGSELELRS